MDIRQRIGHQVLRWGGTRVDSGDGDTHCEQCSCEFHIRRVGIVCDTGEWAKHRVNERDAGWTEQHRGHDEHVSTWRERVGSIDVGIGEHDVHEDSKRERVRRCSGCEHIANGVDS